MSKKFINRLKIITFSPNRNIISPIEKENHNGARIHERPHILAPKYKKGY